MRSLFTYQESIHFIAIFSHKHFQVAQRLPVSAGTATGSSEAMPKGKQKGNGKVFAKGKQMPTSSSGGSSPDVSEKLREQMTGTAFADTLYSKQCRECKLWFPKSCC